MEISVCFLHDYSHLEQALVLMLSCSRQQIKRQLAHQIRKKKVVMQSEWSLPIDLVNHHLVHYRFYAPSKRSPTLVEETSDFLVIDKPAEVHCESLCYSDLSTIDVWLRQYYPQVWNRGGRCLYRLDLHTSGLMIIGKNKSVVSDFRNNFSSLIKKKIYYAVVDGKIDKEHCLSDYIDTSKTVVTVSSDGDHKNKAQIDLVPLYYCIQSSATLVKVTLYQGHRHQIRAQLAYHGYPIWGDDIYGGKNHHRLLLHCHEYQFTYQGNDYQFSKEADNLFFSIFPDFLNLHSRS